MLPVEKSGNFSFYQVGVVSYAIGCGRKNLPTVYTRVQAHIDWIEESIEEEENFDYAVLSDQ